MHHTSFQSAKEGLHPQKTPLDPEQLNQVKAFINSRGFKHIEVEMEILDHVASAVEELLAEQPKLSLESAIQKVHASFGVMGFSIFEDEIKASLGKRIMRMYRSQLWQFWSTLNFLKMLTTAALIFAALNLWYNVVDADLFKVVAYGTVAVIGSIPAFYAHRTFKKWGKKSLMLGQLLWPFLFSALGAAYLIQVLPMDYLNANRMMVSGVLAALSLLVSTTTWSALSLTKEVYEYTQQHWLKYVK